MYMQVNNNVNAFPLSLTQSDIYFDQLRNPNNPLYNIGGIIRFKTVDVVKLQEAHQRVVLEHDVFGLRIIEREQTLLQYVSDERNLELRLLDFSSHSHPELVADSWLKSLFGTPVPINDSEMFHAYIVRISSDKHYYVGFAHHLIMDGWGFSNWASLLARHYNAEEDINSYLSWQEIVQNDLKYLESQRYQSSLEYWQAELKQVPDLIFPARYLQSYQSAVAIPSCRHTFKVSKTSHQQLRLRAEEAKVTVAQVYLSVLSAYFALQTGQHELMIGVPAHNRLSKMDKDMLGVFTSVSPLRVSIDVSQNLADFCQSAAYSMKRNFRHQRFPIGHMYPMLQDGHGRKRLYDLGFNYLKLDSRIHIEGDAADLVYLSHYHEATPLMVTIWEYGENQDVEVQLDHNLAYLSSDDIDAVASRLAWMLEQAAQNIVRQLSDFSIVPPSEVQLIKQLSQGPVLEYPQDALLHQLFETQAQLTPHQPALEFRGETLSYAVLEQRASQLAGY
ncbi:MAG: hypothetical protein KKB38_17360, partial [Gammaproteobacteria bacterium]|nr:hypothetical protein [Gammaproteobacteria bacterium]MBU2059490.1 hypothetical protein [Gammaproteobacteria bacterium]MBU2684968.1 hypothetical protein [Gammaproteobacteria bacterium]